MSSTDSPNSRPTRSAQPPRGAKLPAPALYGSPVRGLAARHTEFQRRREEHGGFDSLSRSHAWTVWITCPDAPTERRQPTVLGADLRCDCDNRRGQPQVA